MGGREREEREEHAGRGDLARCRHRLHGDRARGGIHAAAGPARTGVEGGGEGPGFHEHREEVPGRAGDPVELVEGGHRIRHVLEDARDVDHRRVVGQVRDRPLGDVGRSRHLAHRTAVHVDAEIAAAVGSDDPGVCPGIGVADHDKRAL